MIRWQCTPDNFDLLSPESGTHYVRFLRGLELTKEYFRLVSVSRPGDGMRAHLLASPLVEPFFSADREALPNLCDFAERHAFLCPLCEALVSSLARDLAPAATVRAYRGAIAAELDPIFIPPDERSAWRRWYKDLSYQVAREDELVHQRLTWMMQFEGFLFTAFSIAVGGREPVPHVLRLALVTLIPIVGLSGAYAVHRGVRSAHRVLDALERAYLASLERFKASHVRPFGRHTEHRQFASLVFPWIMIGAWALILIAEIGLWFSGDYPR
jgi:hypothetical protein